MSETDSSAPRKPSVAWQSLGVGVFWISLCAAALGVAFFSGIALLLGLFGLVLLAVARRLAAHQLRGLELKRALPGRTFVGESFEIEAQLCNRRRFILSRNLELTDPFKAIRRRKVAIPPAAPGYCSRVRYTGKILKRGKVEGEEFRLTSRWPFGFFETEIRGNFRPAQGKEDAVLVAPNPVIPPFLQQILRQLEEEAVLYSERPPDSPTEFRSLRKFRPGDPVTSIHWPASSRSDSIVVRENDPPTPRPMRCGLLLHQFAPPGEMRQPERFERILRIACGLLLRFWQQEQTAVIRLDLPEPVRFDAPGEAGYGEVLDALAQAPVRPADSLKAFAEGWDIFQSCDQVFVLSDCSRGTWESLVLGKHPSVICIDSQSAAKPKRTPRLRRPRKRIMLR